ncbi:MAG: DNA polymerase III subunit gamma/tau [Verrucomicrobia bacterium]|nr:DNA polymerase III subunit gamma/tau [Verrucomicrobiota bacterium]
MSESLPEALRECRAVQVLDRSIHQERLGHGILLHSSNLEAVEPIARAIAAELLNTEKDPFLHPDCFTLRPSGKARMIKIGSESERTQGEWPQNSMRRLVIDIQTSANQGGRKVGIIFEADRMNRQSANAFLKTLEEPPAGTTLFLLTTRPYDLLDTIRSRCLNFRVPDLEGAIQTPEWQNWSQAYREWLSLILKGPTKKSVPHIVLGASGLNARCQQLLQELTQAAWKQQKESLPENITSSEKDALEVGISRGFRTQLLAEIERLTLDYAREIETLNPGRLPANALHRVIAALEHCAGLLEINFNQAAALELFFLKSLRIWSSVR